MSSLDLMSIWNEMGLPARAVAASLAAMGAGALFVVVERTLVLQRSLSTSTAFASQVRPLLDKDQLDAVRDAARSDAHGRAPLARVFGTALETYEKRKGGLDPLAFTRREVDRLLDQAASEARWGMGFLATVGSIAPFVGLFGTVIGIITAFAGIAEAGGGGIDAVSAGIAEALIVTAAGLVVAIGTVVMFNLLNARCEALDQRMDHAAGEFLDHLEDRHGRAARDV